MNVSIGIRVGILEASSDAPPSEFPADAYLTPDDTDYYKTPSGTDYYQQPE
jgi:hypothetical protein